MAKTKYEVFKVAGVDLPVATAGAAMGSGLLGGLKDLAVEHNVELLNHIPVVKFDGLHLPTFSSLGEASYSAIHAAGATYFAALVAALALMRRVRRIMSKPE